MKQFPIQFTTNDKAIIYLAAVCGVVLLINTVSFGNLNKAVICKPVKDLKAYEIYRLFCFSFAHKNAAHFTNNFASILLLGPKQESKFGYKVLWKMFGVCTFVTGVVNSMFFKSELVGVNSIVFAFLILYGSKYISFSRREQQTLPLTFFLIFLFWWYKEISMAITGDGNSGIAHIIGGLSGAMYLLKPWKDRKFADNLFLFVQDFFEATVDFFTALFNGELASTTVQDSASRLHRAGSVVVGNVQDMDKDGSIQRFLNTCSTYFWKMVNAFLDGIEYAVSTVASLFNGTPEGRLEKED